MLLELSVGWQRCIQVCQVCCKPVEILCQVEEGRIESAIYQVSIDKTLPKNRRICYPDTLLQPLHTRLSGDR